MFLFLFSSFSLYSQYLLLHSAYNDFNFILGTCLLLRWLPVLLSLLSFILFSLLLYPFCIGQPVRTRRRYVPGLTALISDSLSGRFVRLGALGGGKQDQPQRKAFFRYLENALAIKFVLSGNQSNSAHRMSLENPMQTKAVSSVTPV